MSGFLAAKSFWLVTLNVGVGLLVLIPLLLVVGAVFFEVGRRILSRRRDVRFESLPGIGRIPVLRTDPGVPRSRYSTRDTGRSPA